jgi:hypothetical protein
VPTWRITFRTEPGGRRLVADVDADDLDIEARGVHLVLWRTQLVAGRLQRVIVWRLRRDEATVESLCSADERAPRVQVVRAGTQSSGPPLTR